MGKESAAGSNIGTTASCHHWTVLNSTMNGYGQAGINLNDSEYCYSPRNTIINNSQECNDIYGSGITYVTLKPTASGYRPTADNTNASDNAALNLIGIQGSRFPFWKLVAWNVVYNLLSHADKLPVNL
jgi:hypothetical protein